MLSAFHQVEVERNAQQALLRAGEGDFDAIIISLNLTDQDGLRLCSQLRSLQATCNIPILLMGEVDDRPRILRGLEDRRA